MTARTRTRIERRGDGALVVREGVSIRIGGGSDGDN